MHATRDTMLHLIADNLPGIDVWNVRHDADNPAQAQLKQNAINLQFVGDSLKRLVSSVVMNIDVAFTDELTAVDTVAKLYTILMANPMTPVMDYSVSPAVKAGFNVYWNPDLVQFQPVADPLNFRYACSLRLYYRFTLVPGLVQLVT